ncbi:hypothetical protein RHSIM_Rhsim04G0059300 [Rhododendron simsii]|uniref:Uncharacterized protein n=1 Tax=Rhododendron simsii TaxID=118357 RepID=A0A834H1K6_RHOSS|nr:hypothetical protein RHSIM_Rhsim04G0059300 [Rhododendron simsii]
MEKPTKSCKTGGKAELGGNAEENVADAIRRSWNQRDEDALLNAMKEMVVKGERIENSFKSRYLRKVEGMLLVALPGTSFTDNNVQGLRFKSFPYYEDWCMIFGNAEATGEMAKSAADMVENLDEAPKEAGGDSTTVSKIDKSPEEHSKKKAKVSENILAGMNNFADKLGIYFERSDAKLEMLGGRMGYAHDLSKKSAEVNDALRKLPITVESRAIAGMAITQDAQKVDHFFSLDDEENMIMLKKL